MTLDETGRAESLRPETVRPNKSPGQHSPDARESITREERDAFLTSHGA